MPVELSRLTFPPTQWVQQASTEAQHALGNNLESEDHRGFLKLSLPSGSCSTQHLASGRTSSVRAHCCSFPDTPSPVPGLRAHPHTTSPS